MCGSAFKRYDGVGGLSIFLQHADGVRVYWERIAGGLGAETEEFYPGLEQSHTDGERSQWHAGAQEQALKARGP